MDYLSVIPPEIFFRICLNLPCCSITRLGIVYPQLIDNRFWHAIYVKKFRKEVYRKNINWKRRYINEISIRYIKSIYSQFGGKNSDWDIWCMYNPDHDLVSIGKCIITIDLYKENFSFLVEFIKYNYYIMDMEKKWRWLIPAWHEAEEEMWPFFNKELPPKILYYLTKPIHHDWESVILSLIKAHGEFADKYIYDAGEMAQLTLFRLAKRNKRFQHIARNVIIMLISNQFPEELKDLSPLYYQYLRDEFPVYYQYLREQFPDELKDLPPTYHRYLWDKNLDFEIGVALLLRIFIFSDEFLTPPPQHLVVT